MDTNDSKKTSNLNCRKCAHYFVTWDKKFPQGCRAFGFKSKNSPALDVLNSSGFECQQFVLRQAK